MDRTKVEAYENKFPEDAKIDGVVDPEKYFTSKFKLSWFLRERYYPEGGFDMKEQEYQPEDGFVSNVFALTWHVIIYSSYGIQNGLMRWEDMPDMRDDPKVCESINSVALINVNKGPSQADKMYKVLEKEFEEYKDLIDEQIKVLQPDIHIFCDSLYLYKNYFGLTKEHQLSEDVWWIFEKDNKLFLDIFHPANRGPNRQFYVDKIMGAVENWAKKQK